MEKIVLEKLKNNKTLYESIVIECFKDALIANPSLKIVKEYASFCKSIDFQQLYNRFTYANREYSRLQSINWDDYTIDDHLIGMVESYIDLWKCTSFKAIKETVKTKPSGVFLDDYVAVLHFYSEEKKIKKIIKLFMKH